MDTPESVNRINSIPKLDTTCCSEPTDSLLQSRTRSLSVKGHVEHPDLTNTSGVKTIESLSTSSATLDDTFTPNHYCKPETNEKSVSKSDEPGDTHFRKATDKTIASTSPVAESSEAPQAIVIGPLDPARPSSWRSRERGLALPGTAAKIIGPSIMFDGLFGNGGSLPMPPSKAVRRLRSPLTTQSACRISEQSSEQLNSDNFPVDSKTIDEIQDCT
ncbi:hypothetical protein ACN47E_004057 [Coniothyrium glycines]